MIDDNHPGTGGQETGGVSAPHSGSFPPVSGKTVSNKSRKQHIYQMLDYAENCTDPGNGLVYLRHAIRLLAEEVYR